MKQRLSADLHHLPQCRTLHTKTTMKDGVDEDRVSVVVERIADSRHVFVLHRVLLAQRQGFSRFRHRDAHQGYVKRGVNANDRQDFGRGAWWLSRSELLAEAYDGLTCLQALGAVRQLGQDM